MLDIGVVYCFSKFSCVSLIIQTDYVCAFKCVCVCMC